MLRNVPIFVSLAFLVATVALVTTFFIPLREGLKDNLVSELVGLSLEGLLFVGLFQLLSHWKERRDKGQLRAILRQTVAEVTTLLNESAIGSAVAYTWGLRMDACNPNHAERAKRELELFEPFSAGIDTQPMRIGLSGLRSLLDFLESADGQAFKSKLPAWGLGGVNAGLLRLESFYQLAALESPETLAKWSKLIGHFRACTFNPRQFPAEEIRILANALESAEI